MTTDTRNIAVIGGTGQLGAAIARRLAKAGKSIIIGSRDPVKAEAAARQLGAELGCEVAFGGNVAAADAAEVVILTVPFASQRTTLEDIRASVAGKIVVDTTVPLMPPKVMRVQLPPEGSAAQRAQDILGETVRVVSAFHNVAAHKLITDALVDCDVLVFGDDKSAREAVVSLVDACGLRGLHGGVLANSAAAEALTSVLIFLNKNYSVDGAGVRITGQLSVPVAR
ncbi:MAG: NADPH-dependent F420 reductase [Gammaproteobacteria bacterium]|jgi:NADPH-dependent F420 reductase|nr:NADPH-dependent F420 reductase [Gammaproteobacteria bacterium]